MGRSSDAISADDARAPRAPAVYAIADAGVLAPRPLTEAVAAMAEAGVGWIQVRAKRLAGGVFHAQVEACCGIVAAAGVELWIDDRADLAALLPVRGVHVGQRDLPAAAVRRVVGGGVWIGLSTHGLEQVVAAEADPNVDVIAVGPLYATTGKERPDPIVGLELLRRARRITRKPLVAIGGIDAERLPEVLAAGADAAAILGAVCRGDVATNCRRLLAAARAAGR